MKRWFPLLLTAALVGALLLTTPYWPTTLRWAAFLPPANGHAYLLIGGRKHGITRTGFGSLELVDLATGKTVVRKLADATCAPASPTRLWCTGGRAAVELRDAATLEIAADLDPIFQPLASPPARDGTKLVPDPDRPLPPGLAADSVVFQTNDGKFWRLDAGDLRLSFVPRVPDHLIKLGHFTGQTSETTTSGDGHVLCDHTTLDGTCAALKLPGSGAVVEVGRDAIDRDRAHLLLSARRPDGQVQWTFTDARGFIRAVRSDGGVLYVLVSELSGSGHYAVAIDEATGQVKWRW